MKKIDNNNLKKLCNHIWQEATGCRIIAFKICDNPSRYLICMPSENGGVDSYIRDSSDMTMIRHGKQYGDVIIVKYVDDNGEPTIPDYEQLMEEQESDY